MMLPSCGPSYDDHDWNQNGSPTFCRTCHITFPDWNASDKRAARSSASGVGDLRATVEAEFNKARRMFVRHPSEGGDLLDASIGDAINGIETSVLALIDRDVPAGLDVERLARAWDEYGFTPRLDTVEWEAFAAEYARLRGRNWYPVPQPVGTTVSEHEGWADLTDREMLSYAWSVLSDVESTLDHSTIEWLEVATAVGHLDRRLRGTTDAD